MHYFIRTDESLILKDKVLNFLNKQFEKNPQYFRNPNSEIVQPYLEQMLEDILVSYKHAVFSIEDDKINMFAGSLFEMIYTKEQLQDAISLLEGTIIDENEEELIIDKNFFNKKINKKRIENPYVLYSKRNDPQLCYLDQYFYLVNKTSLKKCIGIQDFFKKLKKENPDQVFNINDYISENLMTEFLMVFCPSLFVLFGESFANNDLPVLFTIPQICEDRTNLPMHIYNFVQQFVPEKYLLVSTLNLLDSNYDLKNLYNNANNDYYIEDGKFTIFDMFFLRKRIDNDVPLSENFYIKNYNLSSVITFFNGPEHYNFEVMTYEELQEEQNLNQI